MTMTSQDLEVQGLMLKKSGKAISLLASELLKLNPGSRLPTFSELVERSEFSRGTLQNAMQSLEEIQAISLKKRGHQGTFLIEKKTDVLLKCLGTSYICGIMPIPYTKKYEGFVTGLLHTFSRPNRELAVDIVYMRGSARRIQSVENHRYDFGITSRLSALTAINGGAKIEIVKDFGRKSYLGGQSLFFREHNMHGIQDGMRVGIDRSSIDHVELTKKAVGNHDVQFVDLNYNQIMKMIDENAIDIAVWNIDNLMEHQSDANYKVFDYSEASDETSAVMVISNSNPVLKSVLTEFVDVRFVLKQQNEVIEGKRYPDF